LPLLHFCGCSEAAAGSCCWELLLGVAAGSCCWELLLGAAAQPASSASELGDLVS